MDGAMNEGVMRKTFVLSRTGCVIGHIRVCCNNGVAKKEKVPKERVVPGDVDMRNQI